MSRTKGLLLIGAAVLAALVIVCVSLFVIDDDPAINKSVAADADGYLRLACGMHEDQGDVEAGDTDRPFHAKITLLRAVLAVDANRPNLRKAETAASRANEANDDQAFDHAQAEIGKECSRVDAVAPDAATYAGVACSAIDLVIDSGDYEAERGVDAAISLSNMAADLDDDYDDMSDAGDAVGRDGDENDYGYATEDTLEDFLDKCPDISSSRQ